ncbi:MAG: hypothetical protein WA117_15570 [Verrucomicrobiia bacterium]
MKLKKYRVLINGRNFFSQLDSPPPPKHRYYEVKITKLRRRSSPKDLRKIGFYTIVSVRANSHREAELLAVDILRKDNELKRIVQNSPNDPPKLFAEEITQVSSFRGCRVPRSGLGFYMERRKQKKPKNV